MQVAQGLGHRKADMSASIVEAAKKFATRYGFSVIPVGANKKPVGIASWKPFQESRMGDLEIERLFAGPDVRIAMICGKVSENVEVIDFDIEGFYDSWCALLSDNGHDDLLATLVVQRTPSGGNHVIYRCPTIERNEKLAYHYAHDGKKEIAVETRGEGGYALVCPSPGYVMLQGSFAKVPILSPEEREYLFRAAKILDETVDEQSAVASKADKPGSSGVRPGTDYNNRVSWSDLITQCGGKYAGRGGRRELWTRPGKDNRDTSATTGNIGASGTDYLKVWSTNWPPFEGGKAYDKFGAYATFFHDGNTAKAASALSKLGYGSKPERPKLSQSPERISDVGPQPCAEATEGAESLKVRMFRRMTVAEVIGRPPKPMLIEGLIGEGDSCMMAGKRKSGKSCLTHDMLFAMVTGMRFAGRFNPVKRASIAYFTTEGKGGMRDRLAALKDYYQLSDDDLSGFGYFETLPQLFDKNHKRHASVLLKELAEDGRHYDLIVFDTFAKSILGGEENSNSDMTNALATLEEVRAELGCASLLDHHTGKDGKVRGASAIDGDLDLMLLVDWDEVSRFRQFRFGFAKDLEGFDPIEFELVQHMDSIVPVYSGYVSKVYVGEQTAAMRVMFAMRQAPGDEWTLAQLGQLLPDMPRSQIATALKREFERSQGGVVISKPEGVGVITYRLRRT